MAAIYLSGTPVGAGSSRQWAVWLEMEGRVCGTGGVFRCLSLDEVFGISSVVNTLFLPSQFYLLPSPFSVSILVPLA